MAQWWRATGLGGRLLRAVLLLAAALGTPGRRVRPGVFPGVAAGGGGCGDAGGQLHSDRPSGQVGPSRGTDGTNRGRRAGPIDYGRVPGRVHTDATDAYI